MMRSAHFLRSLAALVTLATGSFAVFHSAAPSGESPDDLALQGSTMIDCVGTACGGNGGPIPRLWSYWVQPGPGGVNRVDIGMHYPMAWITQTVRPLGWTVRILPDSIADDVPFTSHGVVTPQAGPGCGWVMRWTGPTMFTPFQLGHSAGKEPHEVEWDTSDGSVANWFQPVGQGLGPVHSPLTGPIPVQDESGDDDPACGADADASAHDHH